MEKQKSKFLAVVAVPALSLAMAAPALAQADFTGGGGNDLWNNANNWNPVGVPTIASGNITINSPYTVQILTGATTPDIGAILAINNGAHLIINADLTQLLSPGQDATLSGTMTQNGGDVWFGDDMRTSGGTHNMNAGTFTLVDYYRMDSPSAINITGGSFTITTTGGGDGLNMNGNSSTLKVVGDAATLISFYRIQQFSAGTLDIVLKDGGITTIDVSGEANLPGTLNVTLDAGFTPVAGDYTLISAGSLSGAIGTENLPSGGDWSVATVGNDLVLTYATGGSGPIGNNFCGPANLNSTNQSAVISAMGVDQAGGYPLELTAAQMPANQFGIFLVSMTQDYVPMSGGSQGNLCLGGQIGAFKQDVKNSGAAGAFALDVDTLVIPQPGGSVAIQPGETWHFQAWFRDKNPKRTSNFTDGISILFL